MNSTQSLLGLFVQTLIAVWALGFLVFCCYKPTRDWYLKASGAMIMRALGFVASLVPRACQALLQQAGRYLSWAFRTHRETFIGVVLGVVVSIIIILFFNL